MEKLLEQTLGYRERLSKSPGVRPSADGLPAQCYLVIFDRRAEKPGWSERLKWIAGDDVTVVGC
ncbi:hypothetical protein AGMMS4952_14320 [Spirochaetia bacterium]|nr:hypothetical protein AGMMS4952_14320 [Spirochaetia bacterium]